MVRNVKNRESSLSRSSQFFANTDKTLMLGVSLLELHIPFLFVEIEFCFTCDNVKTAPRCQKIDNIFWPVSGVETNVPMTSIFLEIYSIHGK